MAVYQIVVTRIDTIKGQARSYMGGDRTYEPDTVEEVVVYEQRKEMDLIKIIMAVNNFTRTK